MLEAVQLISEFLNSAFEIIKTIISGAFTFFDTIRNAFEVAKLIIGSFPAYLGVLFGSTLAVLVVLRVWGRD